MHYTYILRNTTNNKYYYGASSSIHRKRTHFTQLKMGQHHNEEMQADYNAGHRFDFIVTATYETRKDAFAAELYMIVNSMDNPMCYNRSLRGYKQSEEHVKNRMQSRADFTPSAKLLKVFEEANAARRKRISINGVIYNSILEASTKLKMCRRVIRRKLASQDTEYANWIYVK